MSSKLFIGNLNSKAKERDVEDFFRGFGRIREVVLKDGFGFVDFDDSRDAIDALDKLNGRNLCGDRVRLELSKQGRRDSFRGRYKDDRARDAKRDKYGVPHKTRYRLIVDNLSTRCSWQDLKDLMRSAGDVTYAEAHKYERNVALVCFASGKDLQRAIEKYQGKDINGRRIKLTDDSPSRGREASRSRSPRSRSPIRRSRSPASKSRSRSPPPKPRSPARRNRSQASRIRSRSPPARRSQSPSRSRSPRASRSRTTPRSRSISIEDGEN